MRTSEHINELATALAKAQAEMENAVMNKENPAFSRGDRKSLYADLGAVRDAVMPSLTKNNISVVQVTSDNDGKMLVHTRLIHSSGQWIEATYPIINDTNKPQAVGSALSYARRYSLAAICCIASETDDDGNAAQEHGAKAPEARNLTGVPGGSKAKSREPFTRLINGMRQAQSTEALKEWLKLVRPDIEALPAEWMDEFDREYSDHKAGLQAKAA